MTTIGDLVRGEELEFGFDRRFLRPIIDTLACCLNISASLVAYRQKTPRIRETIARSFENPFVELCRHSEAIGQLEDAAIQTAIDRLEAEPAISLVEVEGDWMQADCFRSIVMRTTIPNLFLAVGPVCIRIAHGTDPLSDKLFRENLTEKIFDCFKQEADIKTSASRIERLMTQRAAIDLGDLLYRSRGMRDSFDAVLHTRTHLKTLTADQLEAITKTITFWTTCTVSTAEKQYYFITDLQRMISKDEMITCAVSVQLRTDNAAPSFATKAHELGKMEAPAIPSAIAREWSVFCDQFRVCRNFHFLERLLVIRLWLHDQFSSLTIESIDGHEHRALFDELAMRILKTCGADACVIYRYHPGATDGHNALGKRRGFLGVLGNDFAFSYLKKYFKREPKHMKQIATDPIKRRQSAAYKSIDTESIIFNSDAEDDQISVQTHEYRPRSFLIAPLLSRGRIWGAVEILGRNPGQIQQRVIRWVEELTRMIVPLLHNQWQLYHFREMSRIAVSDESEEDKYPKVLDHVRSLFLASSARLYLQNLTQTARFETKAHAGAEWPENYAENFRLDDTKSVSATCIARGDLWESGTLGYGRFIEPVESPDRLEHLGHRGVAVIPIRGTATYALQGSCFASMVITSMDDDMFPKEWEPVVETICSQLSVLLEAIHLKEKDVAAREEFLAHTVKTRTERVSEGGERLLGLLGPLFADPELLGRMPRFLGQIESLIDHARASRQTVSADTRELMDALRQTFPHASDERADDIRSIPMAIEDLRKHVIELRKAAIVIAGGRNLEAPWEIDPASWNGTPSSLRGCLLQSFKPLSDREGQVQKLIVPGTSVLSWDVEVRIPEELLIEMINNIIDNAIKYDFAKPSVLTKVFSHDSNRIYILEVRNLAPRLSEDEAASIETGGKRAGYAMSQNIEGTGKGIKYIHEVCARWGLTFKYEAARINGKGDGEFGWHVARLTMRNIRGR